jgi:hypothetical protein
MRVRDQRSTPMDLIALPPRDVVRACAFQCGTRVHYLER